MKVNIVLKSLTAPPDYPPEAMELITEGTLERTAENDRTGWEITYSDSEITGFENSTTKVLCFGNDIVYMHRSGDFDQDLVIEYGKKHHCDYNTEYGRLVLGVYTHRILNTITEKGGELYFKYSIDGNGSLLSENEVYLSIAVRE